MDPKDFQCYYCKEKGHFARNCPKKEGEEAGGSKETAVAEPTKPKALVAAWGDEISDDEAETDAVPNKLCLVGQPSLEEDGEVSEDLFLAKVKSLSQKNCVKLIIKLWEEREDFVKELSEKDEAISTMTKENNEWAKELDELKTKPYSAALCKKCPMLEARFREVTDKNEKLSATITDLKAGFVDDRSEEINLL